MIKKLLLIGCFLSLFTSLSAQTILSPGDIAIIGTNYDASPYEMTIVNLVPIAANTEIRITDYGYDEDTSTFGTVSVANTSEGAIAWTTTSTIPAGTVTKFTISGGATPTVSGLPGNVTVTGWSSTTPTNVPIPAGGDNWFIFQGNSPTSVTTFIFAWTNPFAIVFNTINQPAGQFNVTQSGAPNNNNSYLPTSLTLGTSAIALNRNPLDSNDPGYHGDNNVYYGIKTGTKAAILAEICNVAKWSHNETTAYDISPGGTSFSGTNPIFTITNPNAAPTDIALTSTSINENVSNNATVGIVSSTDADSGNTFTYSLVSGVGSTDNGAFSVIGSNLQINSSPDFETKSSYSIRVRTTDQGSLTFEKSFTITINDLNEAPTNVSLSASSINENVVNNSTVGILSSTDADSGNTFTYSLVSGVGSSDNGAFSISGFSLQINSSPDFETKSSYSIRVRTTDQGGILYFDKSFTITINDLNEAPTNVALLTSSINENVSDYSTVGTLSSTDADSGNTFTYSLVSGVGSTDNAAFTISGSDLLLNSSPDFETKSSYSILVRTTDQGGILYFDKSFTITINDLNEAPTNVALSASTLDENATANSTVGTFSSTDADSGNTFAYTLVAGDGSTDNAAFSISGSDLLLNSSPDFETKTSYSIRVQTTDQGSSTYEKSFTITINDLNEAPTNVALSASTLDENVTASTTVGTLSSTDADSGNTFTYTLVAGAGDTDNAAFTINGSSLKNNYTPDFETKSSYSIRVRTTDQDGLYFEKSFTITINDLDETPPVVAPILSYTTATNVFPIDTAITPLAATNTGGAITSIPGSVSTVLQLDFLGVSTVFDAIGNQYISDYSNSKILKINTAGVMSTFAGSGNSGFLDGTGTSAEFAQPTFLAIDATGNVYVSDPSNYNIRKITPNGVVTTLAGGAQGNQDGAGTAAQFGNPNGLAVDATGNVYVADGHNHSIRKITPEGIVTTIAGGTEGLEDGVGTAAKFQEPTGITIDPSGTLFVSEMGDNPRIRKITSAGVVTTFAGGTSGMEDGTGTSAKFILPTGLTVDSLGTIYVADLYAGNIRKITAAGVVTTLTGKNAPGFGNQDGPLENAQFYYIYDVELDPSGDLIVMDFYSAKIRKIILPIDGYFVSPALPAGLVLDPATGSVSGTPTVASLATDYTVSASNAGGSGTFKLNIAISLPAPTASAQTFCGSKTVADLVATGTNLKWYDVATNGTALEITTAIATGTYYVSQTNNSIESARTAVDITVSTTAAPTASSQTFCGSKTVADLVASGNDLKWYDVATNGTVLNTSTALSLGNYYVSQTINSCESARTLVTVSSNNAVAGTVSEGQLIVRGTKPAPISISLIESFGTVQWQTSLNNIKFTNIVGATGSTLTSDQMGILTRRRFYRAVLTSTCNTATSEVVQVWTTLETKIQDSQCGQTLASLTTNVSAIGVPGADFYRFKVVQGATTRTIVTRTKGFNLKSLEDGFFFNTTYTISVATQSIGLWSAYGPECEVTTPSGLTKIKDSQCGTTLANINNKIVANAIAGVTNYRFKVDHGETTRTIETVAAAFSLKSLVGGTLSGTAYTISVATKYNGVWGDYGQACEVTTPGAAQPSVSRQAATAAVQEIVSDAVSVVAYPNPFDATFKLDFQSSSDANILVSVYDMNGRLLENKEVKSSEINNLELGNELTSGVYNVIINQGIEVKTIRVIKK